MISSYITDSRELDLLHKSRRDRFFIRRAETKTTLESLSLASAIFSGYEKVVPVSNVVCAECTEIAQCVFLTYTQTNVCESCVHYLEEQVMNYVYE